jgi:cell division protein FtsQ
VSAPAKLSPEKKRRGRVIASTVAGAVAASLLGWGAWYGFGLVATQPVARVVLAGELARLSPADLEAFSQFVRATPDATLESIRASARQVPWVRDATVRRVFPDTVEVTFSAHKPFARWNDGELVSETGAVFAAPGAVSLPQLRGPEGSAARVVREYLLVVAAFAPLGLPVTELRLSPRGAWHATLASGLGIALGRGDWGPRAERFVRAWPKLSAEARASDYADLRYPGGFALKRAAKLTLTITPTLSKEKEGKP